MPMHREPRTWVVYSQSEIDHLSVCGRNPQQCTCAEDPDFELHRFTEPEKTVPAPQTSSPINAQYVVQLALADSNAALCENVYSGGDGQCNARNFLFTGNRWVYMLSVYNCDRTLKDLICMFSYLCRWEPVRLHSGDVADM